VKIIWGGLVRIKNGDTKSKLEHLKVKTKKISRSVVSLCRLKQSMVLTVQCSINLNNAVLEVPSFIIDCTNILLSSDDK